MKEYDTSYFNNECNVSKETRDFYPLKTIILAGGRGKRLESITDGKIPKCFVTIDQFSEVKGIDHLHKIFIENNLTDVVFSADYYYSQYEEYIKDKPYSMLLQKENVGNGGAVEQAIEEFGYKFQYLVISPDTFFSSKDLNTLIKNHKIGTISWAVSEKETLIMDSYFGLVVNKSDNYILGDKKLKYWKDWKIENCQEYVKGAINIIDPYVYMDSMSIFKRLSKKSYPIDLYWDILPLIEERNRRRVVSNRQSFLQATIFKEPIIDYGIPERLDFTRKIYK